MQQQQQQRKEGEEEEKKEMRFTRRMTSCAFPEEHRVGPL
jgi:hypothetical protein